MTQVLKILVVALVVLGLMAIAGFPAFLDALNARAIATGMKADGIVVLTGGEDRISAGLDLLDAGSGRRLLISGVHAQHRTPQQLLRRLGEVAGPRRCCIEIGHAAHNTVGNAAEAADWVRKWSFRSIIIVTSTHHMPRSLAEFKRALPSVALVAHPVPSRYVHLPALWADRTSARVVISEYLKFILATARIRAAQVVEALEPQLVSRTDPDKSG